MRKALALALLLSLPGCAAAPIMGAAVLQPLLSATLNRVFDPACPERTPPAADSKPAGVTYLPAPPHRLIPAACPIELHAAQGYWISNCRGLGLR